MNLQPHRLRHRPRSKSIVCQAEVGPSLITSNVTDIDIYPDLVPGSLLYPQSSSLTVQHLLATFLPPHQAGGRAARLHSGGGGRGGGAEVMVTDCEVIISGTHLQSRVTSSPATTTWCLGVTDITGAAGGGKF